jgi:D-serine dehydratase
MEPYISGCYTVSDERMYRLLTQLADTEGIYLEPSALAGMYGPVLLQKMGFRADENATHMVWATGGSMVPENIMAQYYEKGKI